jgi:hypothetical protein
VEGEGRIDPAAFDERAIAARRRDAAGVAAADAADSKERRRQQRPLCLSSIPLHLLLFERTTS